MSIRFAGSRCVDERRRRRLAQEADAPGEEPVRRAPIEKPGPETAEDPTPQRRKGETPADTLISPRLWKHVVVGVLTLVAWGVMLYLGDRLDQEGSPLRSILGLASGKAGSFFSSLMLLTAGQLSLINLWYRSRSRKDFSGSYKLWFWTAIGWLTLCAAEATDVHWSLADAVLKGGSIAFWNARLFVWLVPGAIFVMALYRLLVREMRDCRASLWFLRLSAGCALIAGVTLLIGPFLLSPRWETLTAVASATLWHGLLAFSMLLHARHVIHVTNEPPISPLRPWRMSLPAIRIPVPRLRLPRRSARPKKEKVRKDSADRKKPPVEQDSSPARSEAKALARDQAKETQPSSKREEVKSAPEQAEPNRKPAAPHVEKIVEPARTADRPRKDERTSQLDPPHAQAAPKPKSPPPSNTPSAEDMEWDDVSEPLDPEMLKGLSKKEKRRLRKLHKEKLRSGRS